MIVVVEMSSRLLIFGKAFYSRTVRKKNIRPAVVVTIEDDGAVAGGFNDKFLVGVAA
jgi:hypothetical protein